MPSGFFNIRIRPFIALFFIATTLSVLIASIFIAVSYQQGYTKINTLEQQAREKSALAKQIQDQTVIQISYFKDLLLQGKDPDKYYEHLARYYDAERSTLLSIKSLDTDYNHSAAEANAIKEEIQHFTSTATTFRKALRLFNSTDVDPELAASSVVEDQDKQLMAHLSELNRIINDDTQISIDILKKEISTRQNYTIAITSIILFFLLMYFYRVLDRKVTQPVTHMVRISDQFAQSSASPANLADLDSIIEQLDKNATQINQIMNSTGEAIYTVNKEGHCNYANPACAKLLGYENQSFFIGKHMHELIHYKDKDGNTINASDCKLFLANQNASEIHSDDDVFWHKDGHAIPVEYHSYPVIEKGNTIGSVITFSDISERRKTQMALEQHQQHLEQLVDERTNELKKSRDEALKANLAKDTFLSQMSHELRTPMNAILGFAQILKINKDEPLTELQTENVGHIATAGDHLLGLINQILDLTHMNSGKFKIDPSTMNINPIIESVIKMIRPLVDKKSIRMVNKLPSQEQLLAYVDEHALSQVLINLISNAVKFSPESSSITLSSHSSDQMLKLCIADEGPGISSKDQQRIFQPFERIDSPDFVEGSGIGLTVCKNIMDLMDGNIGVESQQGKGSTFWIELPIRK